MVKKSLAGIAHAAFQIAEAREAKLRQIDLLLEEGREGEALDAMRVYLGKKTVARAEVYDNFSSRQIQQIQ